MEKYLFDSEYAKKVIQRIPFIDTKIENTNLPSSDYKDIIEEKEQLSNPKYAFCVEHVVTPTYRTIHRLAEYYDWKWKLTWFFLNKHNKFINNIIRLTIDTMFINGCCYEYATLMLNAFPDGYIAWLCPYNHIAYVEADGTPWDIRGVVKDTDFKSGRFYIIPIDMFPDNLMEMYVRSKLYDDRYRGTLEDYMAIFDQYAKDNNLSIDGEEYARIQKCIQVGFIDSCEDD